MMKRIIASSLVFVLTLLGLSTATFAADKTPSDVFAKAQKVLLILNTIDKQGRDFTTLDVGAFSGKVPGDVIREVYKATKALGTLPGVEAKVVPDVPSTNITPSYVFGAMTDLADYAEDAALELSDSEEDVSDVAVSPGKTPSDVFGKTQQILKAIELLKQG